MVTPTNFPQAASFGDTFHWGGPPDGTDTEADWKAFWKGLFKLAKDRAIDPYIVDWCAQLQLRLLFSRGQISEGILCCDRNVFLSEGFKKAYDSNAITDHDGSGGDGTVTPTADRYQREVITQVINEYEDLAGIGITLGERMQNLGESTANLTAQLNWIDEVGATLRTLRAPNTRVRCRDSLCRLVPNR